MLDSNLSTLPAPELRTRLTRKATDMFHDALKRRLELGIDLHGDRDHLVRSWRIQRRYWDYVRSHSGSEYHAYEYLNRLRRHGVPEDEVQELIDPMILHHADPLMQPTPATVAAVALEAGIPPSPEAHDAIRATWLDQEYAASLRLESLVAKGADLVSALDEVLTRQRSSTAEVITASPAVSQPEPLDPTTVEQAVEEFCARNSSRKSAANGVRLVGKLFTAAVGDDRLMCTLTQKDVDQFVDMLRNRLPTQYGQSKEDRDGGIHAALKRAATLPREEVGVSPQTEAKHLCHLGQLIGFAKKRSYKPLTDIDTSAYAKERADEKAERGRGRSNWTVAECELLLQTPPYTGCKGPGRADRNRAGSLHYHDADYWMPLMLALTGARSSELGGLLLDDICPDAPIPYMVIHWNGERRVKSPNSVRKLPVHPELLRLGFLEYVQALRAAGQRLLFPELEPGGTSPTFASVYYKHFTLLRECAFPNGTDAASTKGGRKSDKDVHSFRGMVINLLKRVKTETRTAILGHEQGTTAAKNYEDFELEELLEALAHTTCVTASLEPRPIALNPVAIRPRKRRSTGEQ